MKKCELCSHIARIYCHSDNASLCYNCDLSVHSSNFLVAKHSRTLLCHKCQSPTSWTAAGLNLGRAATVCVTCLHRNDAVEQQQEDEETDDDDDDTESSDEDEIDDDEAENQVVPWSSSSDVSPPVVNGSSGDEGSSSRSVTNREGLNAYIDSEDDSLCSSERCNGKRSTDIQLASFRPLKVIRSNRN